MTKGGIFLTLLLVIFASIAGCAILNKWQKPSRRPQPPPPQNELRVWTEAIFGTARQTDQLSMGKWFLEATNESSDGIDSLVTLFESSAFKRQVGLLKGEPDLAVLWRDSGFPLPDQRLTNPKLAPRFREKLHYRISRLAVQQTEVDRMSSFEPMLDGANQPFDDLILKLGKQQKPFGRLASANSESPDNPFLTKSDLSNWEVIDGFLREALEHPIVPREANANTAERLDFLENASQDQMSRLRNDVGVVGEFYFILRDAPDLPLILQEQSSSSNELKNGDNGKDGETP